MALRIKTNAFRPIGDRAVNSRPVRYRVVSIGGRAVGSVVRSLNGVITIKAASMHALRDLCFVNYRVRTGPSGPSLAMSR